MVGSYIVHYNESLLHCDIKKKNSHLFICVTFTYVHERISSLNDERQILGTKAL